MLRKRPIIGRTFQAGDDVAGAEAVAIVSHGLWQSRFAGDSAVVGRTLTVDGQPRTVVGVMPPRFGFPANEDVWLPLQLSLDGPREDSDELGVFGRLRDEVSFEQADQEMSVIASRLARQYPETNQNVGAGIRPYGEGLIDPNFARGLFTMLAAVSFVLLIACVNVANLLLARAINRTREIAVRSALGASRLRIVSQFLIESFVVVSVGGVLGTLLAWRGVSLFNETLTSVVGMAIPRVSARTDSTSIPGDLVSIRTACRIS